MIKFIKRLFTGKVKISATGIAAVGVAFILASWVILGAFLFFYAKFLKK